MAFIVSPDRKDASPHHKGLRMKPVDIRGEELLPKYNRESWADVNAARMEHATDSFLNRRLGNSDAPHKGKRMLEASAQKPNVYLFEQYGSFPPPPTKPPNTHEYTEEHLRSLMHSGTDVARQQQREYMETTPSLRDRDFQDKAIVRFFGDPSSKAMRNLDLAKEKGYGKRQHGLLDDILEKDVMRNRGKKVGAASPFSKTPLEEFSTDSVANKQRRTVDAEDPDILGFPGVGRTPGNRDPDLHPPHRHHPDYSSYDPLHMRERHASPRSKPIDDLVPPKQLSQLRKGDGVAVRALMHPYDNRQGRLVQPTSGGPAGQGGANLAEVPRSTKKFPQYQVAVSSGPNLIPGFQSLGACDVHTGGVRHELPPDPHPGLKHVHPVLHTSHMQQQGPTSTTKRLIEGEPGDGRGLLYDIPARARSTEPWRATSLDYGGANSNKNTSNLYASTPIPGAAGVGPPPPHQEEAFALPAVHSHSHFHHSVNPAKYKTSIELKWG